MRIRILFDANADPDADLGYQNDADPQHWRRHNEKCKSYWRNVTLTAELWSGGVELSRCGAEL
jgi:hypothetical protein